MNIKLHNENAKVPTLGEKGAAGYDLYASESVTIGPHERCLVKTDISMAIPNGFYGRIAPRSGLAYKHGIDVMAGVIDCSYRGKIGVILYNTDYNEPFVVENGDRIAQIIFERYEHFDFNVVENLDQTQRGEGGFGHTGK